MKTEINKKQKQTGFTLRGLENTRIESLSDGVFAIAIGLLLLSANPPTTFNQLVVFVKDFAPFAATISILMWIWYEHYLFFIRFGLRDAGTTAINTILLFLVLFYTYPLKFMFRVLIDLYKGLITNNQELLTQLFSETIAIEDTPTLMTLYGVGASSIFFVFVWLNKRALNRADVLNLSAREIQLTKNTILSNIVAGSIPLASAIFAFFEMGGRATFAISGFIYMAYGIAMPLVGKYSRKKLAKLAE